MPWKESTQMEARARFIEDWFNNEYGSFVELCRVHGVSRKTGYKWVERFKQGGAPALDDQPRRWRSHAASCSAPPATVRYRGCKRMRGGFVWLPPAAPRTRWAQPS